MSPNRRVLSNVLVLLFAAATCGVPVARAQFYDPVVQSIDLTSDVWRSPRLVGMGGLSLVIPDRDNRITLWDFARSPLGVFAEDTVGTVDLRPETGSVSGAHLIEGAPGERQDLAGRMSSMQFESFYRDDHGTAYGAAGVLNSVRRDTPYGDDIELRRSVGLPEVMPILNGILPHLGHGKIRYALRMRFGGEHLVDQYRTYVTNANGEYISLDGITLNAPAFFDPDEYRVNTSGIGGGLSYPVGSRSTLALGLDTYEQRIKGSNNGDRYSAEQRERRPYTVGQASLVGRLGDAIEFGVDGHGWLSRSERSWYFTISAGVGAVPLTGRGKLLERKERGSSLNTRARFHSGNFELGARAWTRATKVEVLPPDATDLTSFNRFLNVVYLRQGADTLAKPDSVVASETRDYAVGFGGGASMKFRRGIVGVEYHWSRDVVLRQLDATGPDLLAGPKAITWDIRSGLEYRCTPTISGRLGYGYRWWDQDDFTHLNEFKGHSVSLGMGVRPPGTSWRFESGWTFGWNQPDFGNPLGEHGTRQFLATQVHWEF